MPEELELTVKIALKATCAFVGGEGELSKILGVSKSTIGYWKRANSIPAKHAKAMSNLTGGRLSMKDYCPQYF